MGSQVYRSLVYTTAPGRNVIRHRALTVSSGLDSTAQQLLLSHSVTSFGKNLVPLAPGPEEKGQKPYLATATTLTIINQLSTPIVKHSH